METASLVTLSKDALLFLASYLSFEDFTALASTCKRLYDTLITATSLERRLRHIILHSDTLSFSAFAEGNPRKSLLQRLRSISQLALPVRLLGWRDEILMFIGEEEELLKEERDAVEKRFLLAEIMCVAQSCPSYSDYYGPANLVRMPARGAYCSGSGYSHATLTFECDRPCVLTGLFVRSPTSGYTAPCDDLLVWIFPTTTRPNSPPDVSMWVGTTKESFLEPSTRQMPLQPTLAVFGLCNRVQRQEVFELKPMVMRTMIVLALRTRPSASGDNVDVESVWPLGCVW